ncbi:hypothetical protein, partial [Staphylococcus borealis]
MQTINQEGSILHIIFENIENNISKIYVKNEFDSITYESENKEFKIDLKEVASRFKKYKTSKIYIVIEEQGPILITQKNLKVNDNKSEVYNLSEINSQQVLI